jgi:hypothetical protein
MTFVCFLRFCFETNQKLKVKLYAVSIPPPITFRSHHSNFCCSLADYVSLLVAKQTEQIRITHNSLGHAVGVPCYKLEDPELES